MRKILVLLIGGLFAVGLSMVGCTKSPDKSSASEKPPLPAEASVESVPSAEVLPALNEEAEKLAVEIEAQLIEQADEEQATEITEVAMPESIETVAVAEEFGDPVTDMAVTPAAKASTEEETGPEIVAESGFEPAEGLDKNTRARIQDILEKERELAVEDAGQNNKPIWSRKTDSKISGKATVDGLTAMAPPELGDADVPGNAVPGIPMPVPPEPVQNDDDDEEEVVVVVDDEPVPPPPPLADDEGEVKEEVTAEMPDELPRPEDEELIDVPGIVSWDQLPTPDDLDVIADDDGEGVKGDDDDDDTAPDTVPLPTDPATQKILEVATKETIEAQALKAAGRAKFTEGMNLYNARLFEDALRAFEEAIKYDPDHAEAREKRNNCRKLLGRPGPDKTAIILEDIVNRETTKQRGVEMQMQANLENAEKLYMSVAKPSEIELMMNDEDQISTKLGKLEKALEKIRKLDSLLASSPIPTVSQKTLRLRSDAIKTQVKAMQAELTDKRSQRARDAAKKATEERRLSDRSVHLQRIDKLLTSAGFHFSRKEYDKTRNLCEEVMKMDPDNSDAVELRNRARSEYHKKKNYDNETQLHDSEERWILEVRKAAIQPSDELVYPENWEQIKQRASSQVDMMAGTAAERGIRDKLERTRITVEYNENPLGDVLRQISERGRVNIVPDSNVDKNAPVTLTVTDMTLGRVLDWIMEITSLHYEIRNQAIYVSKESTSEVVLQLYPVYDLTRPMRNFYAPTAAAGDDDDDDDDDDGTGIQDIQDRIRNVVAPGTWDQPGVTLEIWQDNLIVMQTPDVHQQLLTYLNRLREASKQQVLVEGRFVNITDTMLEEIGISWFNPTPLAAQTSRAPFGLRNLRIDDGRTQDIGVTVRPGVATPSGPTTNQGANLAWGYLSTEALHQFEVNAVLHALNEKNQGSVLHNPRLLVANGRNAYLEIFTTTNYIRQYTQQGDVFQPEVDQYDQGVSWSVRPVISFDRKYITVRVRPRIVAYDPVNTISRSETRWARVGGAGNNAVILPITLPYLLPVLVTTQLETNVTIPDGGTVLMGGLIQDSRTENSSGVPIISSVPFLGRAFRSETRNFSKQNLVIMLQGKIIELDK